MQGKVMQLRVRQTVDNQCDEAAMRVMSYNIRMAPCKEDDATENAWKYRLPKIGMILQEYTSDIIGLQEISAVQKESLEKLMNQTYLFLTRFPQKEPIESGLGIAYNPAVIEAVSPLKTLWLNEDKNTPYAPAWDGSDYERYVIYAKFRHRATGRFFWFVTTHFDHLGERARTESANIVMDLAKSLNEPVIITGDFNCFPQQGGQQLYDLLCNRAETIYDSGKQAAKVVGVPGTWIGWHYDPYAQKEGHAKYDYIFVHKDLKTLQHAVIDDRVWDEQFNKELYPSDHRPVISDLML